MPQFSEEVLKRMREKARVVKQRMAGSGGDFARYAGLTGKNAIAAPGESVEVRALPRWDFAAKRFMKVGGKTVENPKYVREECWFGAWEHWFDNKDGNRQRSWCRKNLGGEEECPLCLAAAALKGSREEAEREQSRSMMAKEVYLYNVILRANPYGDDGKPAIKILMAPATVYVKINDLCTGADNEKYMLGDVSDPWEGYDLRIFRPATQNDRYDVKAAPKATRLFEQAEAAKWQGWYTRLYDLEEDVMGDVPSAEQMEKDLYGEAGGQAASKGGPAGEGIPDAAPSGHAATGFGVTDDEPFGDIGMPEEEPGKSSPPPARVGPGRRR